MGSSRAGGRPARARAAAAGRSSLPVHSAASEESLDRRVRRSIHMECDCYMLVPQGQSAAHPFPNPYYLLKANSLSVAFGEWRPCLLNHVGSVPHFGGHRHTLPPIRWLRYV